MLSKDTVVCLAGARSLLRPEKKYTFVCLLGARFWRLRTEKKIKSSVWRVVLLYQFLVVAGNWQFFCCGGKFLLRPEKKKYSRLSGGCAIIITTEKKKIHSSVCWVRGSGDCDRKKKDTVVCLAGCAVVLCQFLVLAGNRQFFCCGGKVLL